MEAKKELIAEIQKFWGKNFIKNYIPKCHRPLVKRGKNGKRSAFRQSENDPKKWMPSVLKAVLMIAKKTNDKDWLKEQMRDVVTYRIKHTGNRKPQLVTTDFDVIEDVFDNGWTVAQSFSIRYKHLLMNRGDNVETDEDIAHIFGEDVPRGDDSEDDEAEDDEEDEEGEDGEEGEVADERSEDETEQELSASYHQVSGYILPPQYPLPAPPKNAYNQPHPGANRQPFQQGRANTRPAPQGAAPPPQGFAPPGPRRPPPGVQLSTPPRSSYAETEERFPSSGSNSKRQRSPGIYGFGDNKRNRRNLLSAPYGPTGQMGRMNTQSSNSRHSASQNSGGPKIKTEPGTEADPFAIDFGMPDNDLGPQYEEHDDDSILRLELEAAEAESKRAYLRLKYAQNERKKKM